LQAFQWRHLQQNKRVADIVGISFRVGGENLFNPRGKPARPPLRVRLP
jgi:hypothetical protein